MTQIALQCENQFSYMLMLSEPLLDRRGGVPHDDKEPHDEDKRQ